MSRLRFGELLTRMGKLSPHDIDEILQEQSAHGVTHRFGEIALAWGMVEPEHIWRAWCAQLSEGVEHVNLDEIGIDAQATARMPHGLASRLGVVPIRVSDDEVVIAISNAADPDVFRELQDVFGVRLRFVLADAAQIARAIDRYYAAAVTAA